MSPPLRNARHIRLKAFAHIVIQRELEIIMDTPPIQLMQIRLYRFGFFVQNTIALHRSNDTYIFRRLNGLYQTQYPLAKTIKEPLDIKGRDIR